MDFVKENIKNLVEYKENNKSYKIKLDANEGKNIFFEDIEDESINIVKDLSINRYPDSNTEKLKEEIKNYIDVKAENIITGNGSSEMIDLIMKTFVDKDEKILSFVPTFSMYSIYSQIYSAKFIGIKSNSIYIGTEGQVRCPRGTMYLSPCPDFSWDIDLLIEKATEINPKIILICNPNNPTGYLIPKNEIKKVVANVNSLVVVDEAYIEFADGSIVDEVDNYENLIVLRTLSKALGLAGIRLGYMVSNKNIIDMVNKVKPPYNLNSISQEIGIMALKNKDKIYEYVKEVKKEREILYKEMKKLPIDVYKSNTNFILFKSNIEELDKKLEDREILIRKFPGDLEGYYRVTVGETWENKEFVKVLKEIIEYENS